MSLGNEYPSGPPVVDQTNRTGDEGSALDGSGLWALAATGTVAMRAKTEVRTRGARIEGLLLG
jgi:hypothetical protein